MIEVGNVYVKLAGKEAGLKAVVVDKVDDNFVLVDGEVKRRRCNINHLKPLNIKLDIKPKSSTAIVKAALDKQGLLGVKVKVKKEKPKKVKAPRPKKQKIVKQPELKAEAKPKPAIKPKPAAKKAVKPAAKPKAKPAVKKAKPKPAAKKKAKPAVKKAKPKPAAKKKAKAKK